MNLSLRARLVLIILIPLLIIAALVGIWAFRDAQQRASDRFDLSLLSAALAVSRDVAVSGGDALSPETNALLKDTSGGQVFYHVFAPDGVFVTGYATPPVPISGTINDQKGYEGTHQGEPVRALRFVDVMQIEGLNGPFTITVWQSAKQRAAIVRDLSQRTFLIMSSLLASVALVVWFGVRLGLSPLLDLETAIARRSSDELTPIQRKVPVEAQGIVTTLNGLLGQVASSMKTKDEFISNAAHQLRNPIAGIAAMTEAVQSAKSYADMQERTQELAKASQSASDLAHKLLTLERAKQSKGPTESFTLDTFLTDLCDKSPTSEAVRISFTCNTPKAAVTGDKTMLLEAMVNLIDNALLHGGGRLTEIEVSLEATEAHLILSVRDDGKGIAPENLTRAKERFEQLSPSKGSGLGLAIAQAAAENHNGTLDMKDASPGLKVSLVLPQS